MAGKRQTSATKSKRPRGIAKHEAEAPVRQPRTPREKRSVKLPKLGVLSAAAQVLATADTPMNCTQIIEAITAAGLWSSPKGKTPAQTLYAAIIREIANKGEHARFLKADRGQFSLRK